jgi:hypothetical protein
MRTQNVTVHRFPESDTLLQRTPLRQREIQAAFVHNWLLTLANNGTFREAVNGYRRTLEVTVHRF